MAWLTNATDPLHAEFGSSVSKDVRINRMEPQKSGSAGACSLGVGAWLTRPSHTCVILPNLAVLGQMVRASEIRLENLTLCVPPFKVIGTDMDRSATYDFLLTFHSNRGPLPYRFRDKRPFRSKIANFPTPMYLMPPDGGFFHCNWITPDGLNKLE